MIRRKFITAEDKTVMSGMGSGVIWLRRVKADLPAAEFRKRYVVPFINKKGKESNGRDQERLLRSPRRAERCGRSGVKESISSSCKEISSGRKPGRQRGRGKVQGSFRGIQCLK